jgi:hypothetical protein
MKLFVSSVILAACAPPVLVAAPVDPQAPQAQAEPQTQDNRTPDQVVVDLVAGNNYQCAFADESRGWKCLAPQGWTFYVTQEAQSDGSTQILYSSYQDRAFGKPCANFQFAVRDLDTQGGQGFQADCNDQTRQFELRTRFVYDENLNVVDAANDHLNRTLAAVRSLRDIHTLTKEAGAIVVR